MIVNLLRRLEEGHDLLPISCIRVCSCFLFATFQLASAQLVRPLSASDLPEPLTVDLRYEQLVPPIVQARDSALGLNLLVQHLSLSPDGLTDGNVFRRSDDSQTIARILQTNHAGPADVFAEAPEGIGGDDEPDIDSPGPDMGDFPNSAYTLKKGRTQLEMGPASFRTQNANNSSAYATPFLLRYGLTDDVEFRVLGTGLTSLISPSEITGFGVLTFDTKIHLWNDDIERLVPAVSFEASIQSQLGSPAFRAGIEPGLFINMDFPFTKKTNFEATIGFTGNQTNLGLINFIPTNSGAGSSLSGRIPTPMNPNQNIYAASFQWAVEQEITEKFSLFVHGYYARPVSVINANSAVIGMGFFYQMSKRWMLFGSANAGLTNVPAPFLTQMGIATQF